VTSKRRKTRREKEQQLRQQAATASATAAKPCENRAHGAPIPTLTRKRMAFAIAWAEADPEDSMGEIARRAGYSESSSVSGLVSEICRDPDVIRMRDRRLDELQRASGVTVEDQLLGLRALAEDQATPAKDRVAARKAILAWYAHDKGQHRPEADKPKPGGGGLSKAALQALEIEALGVGLDDDESEAP